MKYFILNIIVVLTFFSCKKEQKEMPEPVFEKSSIVIFKFENKVGDEPLQLNGTLYQNELNQTYSVKAWKYFISNIEFYKSGGLIFKETESYHYISQQNEATLEFEIQNVPVGEYDEIRYSFGIDSINNNGDVKEGDIDPGTGMFWPMGGYRFSNFDGEYGVSSLTFHVGGNSNYFQLTFNNNIYLNAVASDTSVVHSIVDVNKMFNGSAPINFDSTSNLATELSVKPLVGNMTNEMFNIYQVINP